MKLSIVFVLLFFVILSYGCASYTYVTYKNQERNAFLQQTDSSPFQMFDVRGMYFFAYVSEMHYYEEHYYVAGIHIYPYPYPLDTFQVTVENLVMWTPALGRFLKYKLNKFPYKIIGKYAISLV